jgi:hypothetical protein
MSSIASVLLLRDIVTDRGLPLKEGVQGTLVDKDEDGFTVEFILKAPWLTDGYIHEAASLSPETFAITEILENTPTTPE